MSKVFISPTKPSPSARQPVGLGNHHVVEEDLAADDGALPHLAHRRTERQARRVLGEQEGGDTARALRRVGLGEHHVELGGTGVGDPGLLPVEDVARPGPAGRGRDGRGVGPGARLGGGQRGQRRGRAGQRAQPSLLLLRGTESQHWIGEKTVGAQQVSDPGITPAELLLHQALGEHVGEPATAELGRDHEVGDADGGRLLEQVDRGHDVGLVDLPAARPDLAGGELTGQRDDRALLVGQRPGLTGGRHRAPRG